MPWSPRPCHLWGDYPEGGGWTRLPASGIQLCLLLPGVLEGVARWSQGTALDGTVDVSPESLRVQPHPNTPDSWATSIPSGLQQAHEADLSVLILRRSTVYVESNNFAQDRSLAYGSKASCSNKISLRGRVNFLIYTKVPCGLVTALHAGISVWDSPL